MQNVTPAETQREILGIDQLGQVELAALVDRVVKSKAQVSDLPMSDLRAISYLVRFTRRAGKSQKEVCKGVWNEQYVKLLN